MSHRSNRRIAFTTLGCKVNQSDTDEWMRGFRDRGYAVVDFDDAADAYIVNTCTVTHVADRKSRKLLRQARRANPAGLVVATGCYAAVVPADLARMLEVDLVVAGSEKDRLVDLVHRALEGDDEQPFETVPEIRSAIVDGEPHDVAGRTRAFVKIGDGCNKMCAFCIVPYARGRERSLPMATVLGKVRVMVGAGFHEVVLTAVHMGTYGRDLDGGASLRSLIETMLATTGVRRLRLSSIEPEDFDRGLLGLWPDSRLCRHFHLALDSGCDATLQRMRRRYTTGEYADLVSAIRRAIPDVAITTDVMVGFPGETEAEFAESYAFVEQMGFSGVHVFPYSPRARTLAARMPNQVHPDARRDRAAAMLALGQESAARFRAQFIGREADVLFESPGRSPTNPPDDRSGSPVWEGLTDNYLRVSVPSGRPLANQLAHVRIVASHPSGVRGELGTTASHQLRGGRIGP